MPYEFYIGLDVSGEADEAVLSILEKSARREEDEPVYHLRRLERLDGARSAADVAAYVQDLIADEPFTGHTMVIVNRTTWAGRAVLDELAAEGLSPTGVTVTGGDTAADSGAGLFAPEHELVAVLQDLYRSGRLKLDRENTDSVTELTEELQRSRSRSNTGEGAPSAAEAAHPGYVLSTALAAWLGEEHRFDPTEHLGGELPTTGQAKRLLRPDSAL